MSTLRVSNIEAKADVSSPTVDEKIKFTNSSGNVLFHLDGKTSGITTVGINTTGNTFTVNNTTGDISFSGSVTSSGVSTFTSDVSIADKIVHIGDTDTAIRFSDADTITAETGGSERLRITSSGRVGIGLTNPDEELTVVGTVKVVGSSDPLVRVSSTNTAYSGSMRLNTTNNTLEFFTRYGGTYYTNNLVLKQGNVGIGTDNTNSKLHVWDGSLTLESTSASGNAWTYYKNADRTWLVGIRGSSGDALSFYDLTSGTDTERMRIDSGGLVGINQTNPQRHLHVKSGANSNDGAFRIESATSNIMDMGTVGTGHFLNCVNTDPFRIKFAGSEKFRFLSGGGITFNGDTATANALDDYEEGTWTPTVTVGTVTAAGLYTRIGRVVICSARMSNFSNTTDSSMVAVNGIPFTDGPSHDRIVGTVNSSFVDQAIDAVYLGSDRLNFYSSGTTSDPLRYNEINSGHVLSFTITYMTS